MIIDDELNCLLVNPLPPNVRLHAVVDACHSGSVMDLEYRCKSKHGEIHWKMEYARQPTVYKARARAPRMARGSRGPRPGRAGVQRPLCMPCSVRVRRRACGAKA